MECMKNSNWKGFLSVVGKLDGTNTLLKFKLEKIFKGEIFFNQKKRYALDLCAVWDSLKRFIYIYIDVPNLQHNAQIFAFTSIYCNLRWYYLLGKFFLEYAANSNTSYLIKPYKSPYIRDKSN